MISWNNILSTIGNYVYYWSCPLGISNLIRLVMGELAAIENHFNEPDSLKKTLMPGKIEGRRKRE